MVGDLLHILQFRDQADESSGIYWLKPGLRRNDSGIVMNDGPSAVGWS